MMIAELMLLNFGSWLQPLSKRKYFTFRYALLVPCNIILSIKGGQKNDCKN